MALLVAVVSPVVSLGGTRPLLLGTAIAALTVCFLWLERLPLRPGLGVALLLGVALAGALPLAAVADRGEPWFDYKSFAENLGPDDPVRFSWAQQYGPIDWPRDGNEVLRVKSDRAALLEDREPRAVRRLGVQRRRAARARRQRPDDRSARGLAQPAWPVRRHRGVDPADAVARRIAPGTIMKVEDATRLVQPSGEPGRWNASGELRRGDSYKAEVYVPTPTAGELRARRHDRLPAPRERGSGDDRAVPARSPADDPVGRRRRARAGRHRRSCTSGRSATTAQPFVTYPAARRTRFDAADRDVPRLALSPHVGAREAAAQEDQDAVRLHPRGQRLPADRDFTYSERPTPPAAGRAPLDAFLFDTKEGYCQHFAGAMALLLRMGGVPARVATGFSPGGFSKRRDAWIVRDTDAHAWVEAWFDDLGWVTLRPDA